MDAMKLKMIKAMLEDKDFDLGDSDDVEDAIRLIKALLATDKD